MAELTPRQKQFVSQYLIDLNATQAAIRAGYSAKTANEQGARLLANVSIQAAVQEVMTERSKRTGITQDWVLEELYRIAAADRSVFSRVVTRERPETVVDKDTGAVKTVSRIDQRVEMTDTDELTGDQRAAIAGIEETKFGIKVSTYDKLKALELLGRHLGMFTDKVEQTGDMTVKVVLDDRIKELAE